jgi:4-hydroxy-tetrahydrodipicolinate reductase
MKIALIGYGKMGQLIHAEAEAKGHEIVAKIDSQNPLLKSSAAVQRADVCIDFSTPDAVVENVKTLSTLKKNIVIGTTGWDAQFKEVESLVKNADIGVIYASNFSLGVDLFLKMIAQTAELMVPFQQYDVGGIEIHHNQKLDAPSGTAKSIAQQVNQHYRHKPMTFSSIRIGNVPGTHQILFDSPVDTITLTHQARNRAGFAQGAVSAAEWLQGKKGMFTLNDFFEEKLK